MARCTMTAATELSTPPESPSTTSPSAPTRARMSSTWRSTMDSGFQSPANSHTRHRKFSSRSRPRTVCDTSGWNCTPWKPRAGSPTAANSQSSERA